MEMFQVIVASTPTSKKDAMLAFFKQVYSGTLHIAMQEQESAKQPRGMP
jgi:non-canonical (house-cleaning) NTP pyrophosphatase